MKNKILNLVLKGDSFSLSIIYTIGHVIIAMSIVKIMTGASLWEAGTVALVEPTINGIWFYFLHRTWKKFGEHDGNL